ncbi:hypothetical protein GQ55_9G561700 [Panicum hallii var. hallii]|uniref:Uncharacterized protein n=1 Tax=Panicum hallii var. hallii TaxID=1504633 RepID=A0A2T7CFS2_9POAL|nr:hypothetical protein GQ55_9G561700 [Panicum hallii var. hallii]
MLPAARAVARTPSTAARPVAQPPSRHPGRGHVRPRHSGRVLYPSQTCRKAPFGSRPRSRARPPRARLDPTKSTSRFSVAASAGGACRARAVSVAGVAAPRHPAAPARSPPGAKREGAKATAPSDPPGLGRPVPSPAHSFMPTGARVAPSPARIVVWDAPGQGGRGTAWRLTSSRVSGSRRGISC